MAKTMESQFTGIPNGKKTPDNLKSIKHSESPLYTKIYLFSSRAIVNSSNEFHQCPFIMF